MFYNCGMNKNYLTIRLTKNRKMWLEYLTKLLNIESDKSPADVIDFALAFTVTNLMAKQFNLSRKEHPNHEQE